jgi:hypothetical protein
VPAKRYFQLVLVKPSHYDDDAYVTRWCAQLFHRIHWPPSPASQLIAQRAKFSDRTLLSTSKQSTRRTRASMCRNCSREQFRLACARWRPVEPISARPRYRPPLPCRRHPARNGWISLSGCLSMLDGRAVELVACRDMGISMFAGEAEGRLEQVLQYAAAARLAPVYVCMKDLPNMGGSPCRSFQNNISRGRLG